MVLYYSGGCPSNVSRDCCRRTSYEAYQYPFAVPIDEWSRCYQSFKTVVGDLMLTDTLISLSKFVRVEPGSE